MVYDFLKYIAELSFNFKKFLTFYADSPFYFIKNAIKMP